MVKEEVWLPGTLFSDPFFSFLWVCVKFHLDSSPRYQEDQLSTKLPVYKDTLGVYHIPSYPHVVSYQGGTLDEFM